VSWLRIDDGFTRHPKVMRLVVADRWRWLDVLCYCAQYRTNGVVVEAIGESVRGATPAFLERCFQLGLLDLVGDEYVVHDWSIYNGARPDAALDERVATYLVQYPQASANEVARAVGGNRKQALDAVARYRSGSNGTTDLGTTGSSGTDQAGTGTGTELVTRAHPHPHPQKNQEQAGRQAVVQDAAEPAEPADLSAEIDKWRRDNVPPEGGVDA
jgi:hypothetical protein